MKAILGLGNPGLKFKFSRHNLGFLVVERLAKAKKIKLTKRIWFCLLGTGAIGSQEILLAKPLTYVNLSGRAAALIVKRKRIKIKNLLVICDDVNLPLGKIRIRAAGSDGGHKGLRSIIETLEARDFARLRIGVGLPQKNRTEDKLSSYVLGKFNKEEIEIINKAVEEAICASIVWTTEGIAAAMNKFN